MYHSGLSRDTSDVVRFIFCREKGGGGGWDGERERESLYAVTPSHTLLLAFNSTVHVRTHAYCTAFVHVHCTYRAYLFTLDLWLLISVKSINVHLMFWCSELPAKGCTLIALCMSRCVHATYAYTHIILISSILVLQCLVQILFLPICIYTRLCESLVLRVQYTCRNIASWRKPWIKATLCVCVCVPAVKLNPWSIGFPWPSNRW